MKHLLLHTYEIHMYDIRKSPIHKNARLDTHHCGYDNGNSFLVFSYQRNLHICPYFFHSFIKRSDGLALSGALGVKEGIYGSDLFLKAHGLQSFLCGEFGTSGVIGVICILHKGAGAFEGTVLRCCNGKSSSNTWIIFGRCGE